MAQKAKGYVSAEELENYCHRHLKNHTKKVDYLYRIFYYDCMPTGDIIYHPYLKEQIDYSKTDIILLKMKKLMNLLMNLKRKGNLLFALGVLRRNMINRGLL